jgi:hypothetical protein
MSIFKKKGWIGFDFDGTLAIYNRWRTGDTSPPVPIMPMVEKARDFLAEGWEVRILTGLVSEKVYPEQIETNRHYIRCFCLKYFRRDLQITSEKDQNMQLLFDDRAIRVEKNTGRLF